MNILTVRVSFSVRRVLILWFLMEINFLTFCGFLALTNCKRKIICRIKYFCIQALVSIVIFFCFVWRNTSLFLFSVLMTACIFFKLGAAPFHSWFFRIMVKLSWFEFFWIGVFQKIIPLIIVRKLFNNNYILFLIIGTLVSALIATKCLRVKKVITVSRVFNLNWTLRTLAWREIFWLKFILAYRFALFIFTRLFREIIFFRNTKTWLYNFFSFIILVVIIINLAGIPPITIFVLKLKIIKFLVLFSWLLRRLLIVRTITLIFSYISFTIRNLIFYKTQQPVIRLHDKTKFVTLFLCFRILTSWWFIILLQNIRSFDFLATN